MLHSIKLALIAIGVYLLIPILGLAVLVVLGLGLASVIGLAWGLLSLAGWLLLGDPNAGRAAVISLSLGAAAFASMTLLWDRVFALWRWATGPRDAAFLG